MDRVNDLTGHSQVREADARRKPIPVLGDGSTRAITLTRRHRGRRDGLHHARFGFEIFNLGESHTVTLAQLTKP
jgi:hypothetical protein